MTLAIFDAAVGQTMVKGEIAAQTVCSSTHQVPDATMPAIKRCAQAHQWGYYPWCYQECLQPHAQLPPAESTATAVAE